MSLVATLVGRRCPAALILELRSPTKKGFMVTKRVIIFRKGATHEPRHDIGRAVLPRRLNMKAVRQHSPTRKRFIGTKRVIIFRMQATHEAEDRLQRN